MNPEIYSACWFTRYDHPESVVLPADTEDQAEDLIRRLSLSQGGEAATIPLVDDGRWDEYIKNARRQELLIASKWHETLPPILGQPINDDETILAIARKLGLVPRLDRDNFLYKTGGFEYVAGLERGVRRSVYNCFRLTDPRVPKHTYWHELLASNSFATEAKQIAITMHKPYRITNGWDSKLRYWISDTRSKVVNKLLEKAFLD